MNYKKTLETLINIEDSGIEIFDKDGRINMKKVVSKNSFEKDGNVYENVDLHYASPVYIGTYEKGFFKGKKYLVLENKLMIRNDINELVEGSWKERIWNECKEGKNEMHGIELVRYRIPFDLLRVNKGHFSCPVKNDSVFVDIKFLVRDFEGDFDEIWKTIQVSARELQWMFME